jgi:hypothetical protein
MKNICTYVRKGEENKEKPDSAGHGTKLKVINFTDDPLDNR